MKVSLKQRMGHRMYITEREAKRRYSFFFFLPTGQETTSAMLAFMLAEVGKHPEVEER